MTVDHTQVWAVRAVAANVYGSHPSTGRDAGSRDGCVVVKSVDGTFDALGVDEPSSDAGRLEQIAAVLDHVKHVRCELAVVTATTDRFSWNLTSV